jgi:hypothetical protein
VKLNGHTVLWLRKRFLSRRLVRLVTATKSNRTGEDPKNESEVSAI